MLACQKITNFDNISQSKMWRLTNDLYYNNLST